jgi:hypothetical protein
MAARHPTIIPASPDAPGPTWGNEGFPLLGKELQEIIKK